MDRLYSVIRGGKCLHDLPGAIPAAVLNNTYFSSGNNTATCTSPAAAAAMVLPSAAKVVADNLAVIHPCSQVEKRISRLRIIR